MRTSMSRILLAGAACALALYGSAHGADQAACQSLTPAITGGPTPSAKSDTVLLRWLGTANYEIAYRGHVFLFDAYFDRPGRTRPLGFTVADIRKADVIFLGHAHSDHISDIAPVARQTGALVVGAPITIATAVRLGVPESQTRVVKGGETLMFGEVKVMTALARHSTIQDGLIAAHRQMYAVDALGPLPPEQQAHDKEIAARGTNAPEVITEGTIAYAVVLPSGFSIVDFDTAGPITDGDRALAQALGGRADVAIIAYQPHPVSEHQVRDSWPFVETFNPRLVLPSHQDAIWNVWLDLGLAPFFEKLRDERPGTKFVDPLYRSAICVQTAGTKRGGFTVRY